MNNWDENLGKGVSRRAGEHYQYSTLPPDLAKTKFYELYLTLMTKAKEVSDQHRGRIREIQVTQTEGGSIQIDLDDWLSFHIRLDLARSGKRITINGHCTKTTSESVWLNPIVLKLGIDGKNNLHLQRDGREITDDDIAKIIFTAIVTGSDFQ